MKQENYDFVMRYVISCQNTWQLRIANEMISRFDAMYNDRELYNLLLEALLARRDLLTVDAEF